MDNFRQYIENRRVELGISQNQVAKRAKKTSAWLSKFMSGERKEIKLDALIMLAGALEVPEQALIDAYKGDEPKAADLSVFKIRESAVTFLQSLPDDLIADAILAKKGGAKTQELLEEMLRRRRERGAK